MSNYSSKQTAYEHNAHHYVLNTENHDHGWDDAINRMINQRYAFLDFEYEEKGYLFRGMRSGLTGALLSNCFWQYPTDDNATNFERELNVIFLSQDLSDALNIARLWEANIDACILIFKSTVFNKALEKKQAAVMATAEPGVVFKYPFLTTPLFLSDLEYLIINPDLLQVLNDPDERNILVNLDNQTFKDINKQLKNLMSDNRLLIPDIVGESDRRSNMERWILNSFKQKGITSSKVIKSHCKPTRSI